MKRKVPSCLLGRRAPRVLPRMLWTALLALAFLLLLAPASALASAPSLAWNTFLGGAGQFDHAVAVATDGAGNIYVAGSSDAAWGSPVRSYGGSDDAFVAKLSPSGTPLWHTFIGGSGQDFGTAVAVDAAGNAYVAGYSYASWGDPERAFTDGSWGDAFVAKVDASGALAWNTFLGADDQDEAHALVVGAGGVVVAGTTYDIGWGTPVREHSGGYDAFVAGVDSTDGSLAWNTFLDGGLDYGFGLAAGGDGSLYVTGTSNFNWGDPVRPHLGGSWVYSAQVAKLTSAGALVWHTFLGEDVDPGASGYCHYGKEVAVDAAGNVYVLGLSDHTWGTPIRPHPGAYDVTTFVARLGPDGALAWNTFLYGGGYDEQDSTALAVDGSGNVVAGGSSGSWGTPAEAHHGGFDASVAQISPVGALMWNTFVGGTGSEHADALAVDSDGAIVLAGYGYSTWGSPVRPLATASDGIVAKLAVPSPPPDTTPPTTSDDADDLWHKAAVTVTLAAVDNAGGSGMVGGAAKTEYKVDGAASWTTGTSVVVGAPGDHSNDGAHTVSYRSTDAAGNVEATRSCTVRIDTTPPNGTFVLAGGAAETTSTAVTVTMAVTERNGPVQMRFSTDGKSTWSAWTAYAGTAPLTLPDGVGTKTAWARFRDAAGNVLELSDDIELVEGPADVTAPTIQALGATDRAWYRIAVTVTLVGTDDEGGTGVASITYALDGGAPRTVGAATATVSVPVLPNARHTLVFHATDHAANASPEQTLRFTCDSTGPVTAGKAASGRVNRAVYLRYRIGDNLSPKAKAIKIVVKNRAGKIVKTFRPTAKRTATWYRVKWVPKRRGTYRYFVSAKDLAGNAQRLKGRARVVVR